ncbi:alpha/beta hydrolase [Nocardia sp. NPDC020380]|uniref:alpha/beta hydrolase n=1 Tax=Nocardia sp. NPDC020380 TaxID=3364309 RepID=UPI0037AEF2B7
MTKTSVSFDSVGLTLAGDLYIPDAPAGGPLPAIVVGHPGGGVKEQTAGLYARKLSEKGFVTLAFDAAYQGESGGEPRGLEDPAHRVEDLKAAVSFLTGRPEVEADRIGELGICAGGGYALAAAASDPRVQAVATVSAADLARHFKHGGDGTQDPAVFRQLLDAASRARTSEARGETVTPLHLIPDTEAEARAHGGEYGAEGWEYYRTARGHHPRQADFFVWPSIDKLAIFDAFTALPLLADRPALLLAGTRAVTAWMSIEAYRMIQGPKELHWIDGASHTDLYDKPRYVDPAVARLAGFFGTHL